MNRFIVMLAFAVTSISAAAAEPEWLPANAAYYHAVMEAPPILPARPEDPGIGCAVGRLSGGDPPYSTTAEADYGRAGWEDRVAADWDGLDVPPERGRVLLIDSREAEGGPAFRYLANGTRDDLFEPWSASKIMAFTAAVARARRQGVGADTRVGAYSIADLISSIHSYAPHGSADGDSNAIATWFLNVAGRADATALFHDGWLRLAQPDVRLRGAYGGVAFDPGSITWVDDANDVSADLPAFPTSVEDPGYQAYRCEECGLTGNKPMTTLAMAEWLRRLAWHDSIPETRHPDLDIPDIRVLFNGHPDGRTSPPGGMLAGVGRMLPLALAEALSGGPVADGDAAGAILDDATGGRWRIWQKIGWGPSETRGTAENVVLAHVCLPGLQGGRQFTLAAQVSVPGATEENVSVAGQGMQAMLKQALMPILAQ